MRHSTQRPRGRCILLLAVALGWVTIHRAAQAELPRTVQVREALALAPELPLSSPLAFKRKLDHPVGSFLLQGNQIWVRSSVIGVHGGGDAQGAIHNFDGTRWHTSRFYDSYLATAAGADFIAGVGQGMVLAGVASFCCGTGAIVTFERAGNRWRSTGRAFPSGGEFPGFLTMAQGIEPVVCACGSQPECMRWVGGRGVRIPAPPGVSVLRLTSRAGAVVAFAGDQLLAWRGAWIPIGSRLPNQFDSSVVRAVRQGVGKRVWLITDDALLLYDGRSWSRIDQPIKQPRDVLESTLDSIWIAGLDGLAHFDGNRWARVGGLHGEFSRIAMGKGQEIWVGGDTGLWHGTPHPSTGDSLERKSLTQAHLVELPEAAPLMPIPVRFELKPIEERYGNERLLAARAMLLRDGTRWSYDGRAIYRRTPGSNEARGWARWSTPPMRGVPLCTACLAPTKGGGC